MAHFLTQVTLRHPPTLGGFLLGGIQWLRQDGLHSPLGGGPAHPSIPCLVSNETSAQARWGEHPEGCRLCSPWAHPIPGSRPLEACPAPAPIGILGPPLSHSLVLPLPSHHSFLEI